MQFMLFCCFAESAWQALPQEERDEIMSKYHAWIAEQQAAGRYLAGGKLDESDTAHTLRKRDGRDVITDGPFAETREQTGGYHLIECRDREEAFRIAGGIPTLPAGGVVEVREQFASQN